MFRLIRRAALGSAVLLLGQGAAQAQNALLDILNAQLFIAPIDQPVNGNTLLAKAKADECFDGVGNPYPPISPTGSCSRGQRKVNQAYVWGLTESSGRLWFGTAPNVHCLVIGGFLGSTGPSQTKSWVCEFGASQVAQANPLLPDAIGDWRPPRAYEYNIATKTLRDRTPADPRFVATLGLRSAGSQNDVVILAGPGLPIGVNFFAFRSSTGAYLGSCNAPAFTNIRQWVEYQGALYAGVGASGGGRVIRWRGTQTQPFSTAPNCGFEVVASLPGDAAFITGVAGNHLAVSAWPAGVTIFGQGAGVYLSPPLDADGLTAADAATPWTRLWRPGEYEPDLVTSLTYAGGAIVEWNGALYFGTMHVPGLAAVVHSSPQCSGSPIGSQCYGEAAGTDGFVDLFLKSNRAISIWRIQDPAGLGRTTELLYGERQLPALVSGTQTFEERPTGYTPLYGGSGFDNPYNNYTWTATVARGRLYFGTMDWRYLLDASAGQIIPGLEIIGGLGSNPISAYVAGWGSDLWRFDSPMQDATPENVRGSGNYLNYGIRSMVTASDGSGIYIGTANPMNLEAKGGWELRKLAPRRSIIPR